MDLLPAEVLMSILAGLPLHDLHACRATCRRFNSLVCNALPLQYRIELEAAGLSDGPPGLLNIYQRMQLLLRRQRMWRTLEWTRKDVVPYATDDCLTYELFGRVFGQGKGDKGGATTKLLAMTELPGCYLDSPRRYIINNEQLGIPVWDFTMDPAQNLLILVEQVLEDSAAPWRVHFRTLTTSGQHPRARAAVVEPIVHSVHADWAESEFSIKVSANLVVILFKPMVEGGSDHIFVWDWTTGRGCQVGSSYYISFLLRKVAYLALQPLVAPGKFIDFAILSVDALVIVAMSNDQVTLEVYAFHIPGDQRPTEDIKRQNRRPMCTASFELPEPTFSDWWNYSVECLSNCTSRDFNMPGRPFQNDLKRQILAFCFTGHPHRASMVLKAKTLLDYASRTTGTIVPWNEWGENATRWITECCSRDWLCGTHGMRFVTLVPSPFGERPLHHRIRVLDFNPFEVRRFPEERTAWSFSRVVTDKSVIPPGGLWKHEVIGRLPCREVTLLQPVVLSGVMIDECGIVGVQGDESSSTAALVILTL